MLQNPCKTLGFMKNMVHKIPPRGGGKPYPASGLNGDAGKIKTEDGTTGSGIMLEKALTAHLYSGFSLIHLS